MSDINRTTYLFPHTRYNQKLLMIKVISI